MKDAFIEFLANMIVVVIMTGILAGLFIFVSSIKEPWPSSKEVEAVRAKYNCHRTGEFAGKDAVPIYNCDGIKYSANEIYSWAYQEKNK